MMNEDLNTLFCELLSENDVLVDVVTDDLIQFGTYVGGRLEILKECYLALCQHRESYTYQAFLGAPIELKFDYIKQSVTISRENQFEVRLTLDYFRILLGLIDLVYSEVLPLGSVVELDTRRFPEQLKEMFSHTPGAKVIITGRKLPVADNIGHYVVDYQAQLWPLGSFLPVRPMTISNMMIKNIIARGYQDSYETSFSKHLKQSQIQEKRLSTAFMSQKEATLFLEQNKGGH